MNPLWIRQIQGMMRMEMRKALFSVRALPLYILAGLPLVAVMLFVLVSMLLDDVPQELSGPAGATLFYSGVFQATLALIYFAAAWQFMNLFRGEVLDRSLHYYFLSPIRREVLVAGKFISAWLATTILFSLSTVVSYVIAFAHLGTGGDQALGARSLGHLVGYVGVTALGCLGYGAVFLVVGLFLRNPIVPVFIIFVLERVNFLLPPLLKKISVVFYLQSMLPVPVTTENALAVVAEPVPAWLAVIGLVLFSAVVLFLAGLRIRRMEIAYGTD